MSRKLKITVVYVAVFLFAFQRCAYNDIKVEFNCDESTLAISLASKSDVSSCKAIDGVITVTATGGLEPYDYCINSGEYQTNATFNNLGPGTYTVKVKDKNNCVRGVEISIAASGSTLAATSSVTADNQCTTDNGSATINATGGKAPYQYQIDAKGFSTTNSFTGLKEGQHVVVVKDADECQRTVSVVVPHGSTGTSYKNQIKDIITSTCALSGCHDAGTGSRDWTKFDNVKANAANIRARTANRTMPPSTPLTQNQIDLIGCWVSDGALDN